MTMNTNSTATTNQHHVVVRLHQALVPPSLADMAIRSLECTSKVFSLGGPFGLQSKHKGHKFYERDSEGYIVFRAGLVPRVINDLHRAGIEVQMDDRTRWPVLEQAAENVVSIANGEHRGLLNAIGANPRGCIPVKTSQDMRMRLRDLLQLFSLQRVLVVAINRAERDRLCGDLSARLKRPLSTHHGVRWGAPDRVTVITAEFFAGISVVNVDFDVIIFTHPRAVTGGQAYSTGLKLNNELIYCLVPQSYRPDELTQLRLEAVCGAVIHDDVADPTVRVVMVEAPSIPPPGKLTPLARKRAAIWQNDQRNEFIAELALAIAGQDVSTFSHRSEFLPEHVDLLGKCSNPGIAILVESTEHGRELLRRLPHWTLNTANPDDRGAIDSGTCHRCIVTQAFASVGIHTDILIRATGTSSPLMVRGFPSMQQRRAIVLFDMADDFDAHAISNTHERIRDYRTRGWPVEAGNSWIAHQEVQENTKRQNGRGARP